MVLGISVNGSGYTSEIFRDVVSAFDVLQRGNVSVLSQRCVVHPVEPDYGTYVAMGDWGCCPLSVQAGGVGCKGGVCVCSGGGCPLA